MRARKSAASSEMKFGSKDSRVCCICAKPIRISHPEAFRTYHTATVHISWHTACESPGWAHLHTATMEETA